METLNPTPTRKALQLVMATLAAFMLVLAIAPGADAQTRESKTQDDSATFATPDSCPDGFVDSRFGCIPADLTTKPDTGDTGNECPDTWVASNAPGGCSPGFFAIEFDTIGRGDGCPDRWVVSSAPGGCSPGFLTLDFGGLDATRGCPANWVVSSVPGGCSPGFITMDTGDQVHAIQHHCPSEFNCDAMVEAVLALGGHCTHSSLGETCEIPTGPPTRD